MRTRRLRLASALLAAAAVLTSAATATAAPVREVAGDAAARDAGRGDARTWKVVGGADVSDGAWPWVAAIAAASVADPFQATFCTGTVIHPRAVLTAAHCVTPSGSSTPYTASLIDVMTGKTDLYATTGQRIHAQQIAVHPSWLGGIGSPGDAAVVILSEPTAAPPLAVGTPADTLALARPGDTALIAGYGAVDGDATLYPTRLQAAALPIQDDALCSAIWGVDYVPGAQLCAGWELADAAACSGDSGGPLIGQRSDGTWAQLGITSWGPSICDAIEAPGAWTDVGVVSGWIAGVLQAAFAPPPTLLPPAPAPQPIAPPVPPAPPVTPAPVTPTAPATPTRAGPVRIHIEGFRAAAPLNGAAIPRAAARSGGRLSACRQKRAVTVIFSYANLLEADRVRVRWSRNGRPYFLGAPRAPDGSDGRAFRSLSPAPNGRYRAEVLVNGVVRARGTIVKAC